MDVLDYLSFVVYGGAILFWLGVYLYDRHQKAKLRETAMKFHIKSEDAYVRPKSRGLTMLLFLCVVALIFIVFHEFSKAYDTAYQAGYEAGVEAGIEMVKEHPYDYF